MRTGCSFLVTTVFKPCLLGGKPVKGSNWPEAEKYDLIGAKALDANANRPDRITKLVLCQPAGT